MSETAAVLDRIETKIDGRLRELTEAHNGVAREVISMRDRLEGMEAVADRPRAGSATSYTREDNEHKSVFLEWLRKPNDPRREGRLSEAQHELQKKDVTIGSSPGGGYGLPKEINNLIETRVRQLNPFRGLVDVISCNTNDFHSLVSMGDGSSGWVAETATRSATAAPTLRDVAPFFGEQYALPTASNWSLADLFFDVQSWLVNDVSADFAASEATAIISGTGTAQPKGLLTVAPTAVADNASPMRAQDVIEFFAMSSSTNTSPLTNLSIDALIDLVGRVRERYLMEADRVAWCMHRTTVARLRKLKGVGSGLFLWEPDVSNGAPGGTAGRPMLLGYPVITCDAMPVSALNALPVLFGNWRRGYLLADRVGMSIIVDQVTTPGQTRFYVSRRLGGRIKNNDALKALKVS